MDVFEIQNNSKILDIADQVISVPDSQDLLLKDPEVYMKRLADLHTPRERLVEFIKSQFDFTVDCTHEARYVRLMAVTGLISGWIYGGIFKSLYHFDEFRRRHNASVFDNTHRAKRLYVDTYFYNVMRKGSKFGIGTGAFCASAGLITFGAISYRNDLYLRDMLVGFATLGGISRCFLGLRGLIFGSGMGLLAGSLAYSGGKIMEKTSGLSVTQLRYLNHVEYLKKRGQTLDLIHRVRKETDSKILSKTM